MPRFALLALAFCLLPTFAHARLQIIATTQDLASIADAIGQDRVVVVPLLQPGDDPHSGKSASAFDAPLDRADLLLMVGLDFESHWLPALLRTKGGHRFTTGRAPIFDASEGCKLLEIPQGSGDQSLSGNHPFGNPHYWLDPENGRIIAKHLAARLAVLDPTHAVEFQDNLRLFETTLTEKEGQWETMAEKFNNAALLACHDSWANFAEVYHLNIVGTIESVPGAPPSADRVRQIIGLIQEQRVTLVLVEFSNLSPVPAAIASATGAKAIQLATSVGDAPEIKSYTDLVDYNLQKIKEELTAP